MKSNTNKSNNKKKLKVALAATFGALAVAGGAVGVFFAVKGCSCSPEKPEQKYYGIQTIEGEGIQYIRIDDAPIGEDVIGYGGFLKFNPDDPDSPYTKLNIDNCYVEFQNGKRFYGSEVFEYTQQKPTWEHKFTIKHEKLISNNFKVYIDAYPNTPWEEALVKFTEGKESEYVDAHFKENVFGSPILVDFNVANGYKLDIDDSSSTKTNVKITDSSGKQHTYKFNDPDGVFTMDTNGYLMIDGSETGFIINKNAPIIITINVIEATFPYVAHPTGEGFSDDLLTFTDGKGQLYKDIEFTWNLDSRYQIDPFDWTNNHITIKLADHDEELPVSFRIDAANSNIWRFEWNYEWGTENIEQFRFYVKSVQK